MGLNVTAHIVARESVAKELEYQSKQWPLVGAGMLTESDYYMNYPCSKTRNINVSEFGIRNFYGLHKFFRETLKITNDPEESVIRLDKEQVFRTLMAAEDLDIPAIDQYSYTSKCNELVRVLNRALNECDFNTEMVQLQFEW